MALKMAKGKLPTAKLTGLQKDVIHFYRTCVRAANKKAPDVRPQFVQYARSEFEKHRHLNRKDINTVEYLLRTGNRKLDMFSNPNLRKIR